MYLINECILFTRGMKCPFPLSDFCSPILLGSQMTHLHFCIPLTCLKYLYSIPASFVATKNADVSILSTCAMPSETQEYYAQKFYSTVYKAIQYFTWKVFLISPTVAYLKQIGRNSCSCWHKTDLYLKSINQVLALDLRLIAYIHIIVIKRK